MRLLALFAVLLATPVLAVPTPLGPFELAVPGTTVAAEPELVGTVISDQMVPFATPGATPVTGTVQVRVVRAADQMLAFYWRITSAASSKGVVDAFAVAGFPQNTYDADWRKDGLGSVAPTSVVGQVSVIAPPVVWIYGFRFATPIKPGESSRFFFIRTKATATIPATAHVQASGGASAALAVRAPAS